MRLLRLLYRAALLTVPGWLRRKHGREMESAAVEEIRRARRERGITAAAGACAAALGDAVIGGVRARLPVRGERLSRPRPEGHAVAGRPDRSWTRDVFAYDLAVILLVGAWLLAGTMIRLMTSDPGFVTEDVVTARLDLRPEGYDSRQEMEALEHDVLDRLKRDGSVAAAVASSLPLERGINMPMTLASDPDVFVASVEWRGVSPGFFEALEIPLLRGRSFDDGDTADARRVVVVNEAFVRQYFPNRDPLGERI